MMADLSTTLELEFRLLESHIIKKQIREFRKKRPDIPYYQKAINKEIKSAERKESFFKVLYFGGIFTFVVGLIVLLGYVFLYTDLIPLKDKGKETDNRFLSYPKYVQCVDSMKIDSPNFSLDLRLTLDNTIGSICKRSLNYATIEELRDTRITDDQIIDNCFYNKIEKNKKLTLIEKESSKFYTQCAKISEGSSQFTDFFYRDYSNKKYRTFIESWKSTKQLNSMT